MNPRSTLRTCVLLLASASFATPAQAADDAPRLAWGKAGVSYDQYRSDANDCAEYGLNIDVSDTEAVAQLRRATRQLEAADSQFSAAASADPMDAGIRHAQESAAIRAAARPEQQVQAVKEFIFAATQRCMAELGYVLFALTEEQRSAMAPLKKQKRREFLHRLASDGAILEQQRQPLSEG
jgi:hypothetical protein